MNKIKVWILALLLVFAFAVPAHAELQDMWASVYKNTGKLKADGTYELTKVTTGVTYKVLAVDSDTAETLYAYGAPLLTSKTNPITTTVFATDGKIAFRVDPTDSTNDRYVDLIVTLSTGETEFVENFDRYSHSVVIDTKPNVLRHGIVFYNASTTDETSTGVTFAADTMIHDVRTEPVTTQSGVTIDVGLLSSGTGGDANGFIAARSLATAGYTADTGVITAGSTDSYTAASTYGALLYKAITGTGNLTGGTQGGRSYLGHVVTGSNTGVLTYTVSSNDGAAYGGYIHYWFTRLR